MINQIKSNQEIERKKIEKCKNLISNLDSQIKGNLASAISLSMNPGTKGDIIEKKFIDIFEDYMGSRFDFHQKAHIIDSNMRFLSIFKEGENEFDILGTFKLATPKMIVRIEDRDQVPYDSISFIIEIKTRLNKNALKDDLYKLKKLDQLEINPQRFNITVGSQYKVDKPLKILIYVKNEINRQQMDNLLKEYISIWDFILILEEPYILVLNSSLPLIRVTKGLFDVLSSDSKDTEYIIRQNVNFIAFLSILSTSIPEPLYVDLSNFYLKLAILSERKI